MRFTTLICIVSLCGLMYMPSTQAGRSSSHHAEGFLNNSIDNLTGGSKFVCKAIIACYAVYLAWPYLQKTAHDTANLLNHPSRQKFKEAAKHAFILAALAFVGYDFGTSCWRDIRRH